MTEYLLDIVFVHIQQRPVTLQADFHLPFWQAARLCLQEGCCIKHQKNGVCCDTRLRPDSSVALRQRHLEMH